jgi:1,4-dihydroxy-6-naphthoate synthase
MQLNAEVGLFTKPSVIDKAIMSKLLSLGISPCPNDTFIFDAWINGKLDKDSPRLRCCLEDISTLNGMALKGILDVVKVSFYAYGMLRDKYILLNAGGALGRGCGPLLVARSKNSIIKAEYPDFEVAVPGRWTTANLLLSLCYPEIKNKIFMKFDQIIPAVAKGDVDAGVIIHEGRFTIHRYGLCILEDLGDWWERTTGKPVPLGAIIAKRLLGENKIAAIETTIRKSLEAAFADPDSPLEFMRKHAGEMDTDVMRSHVELYVNKYSLDYGAEGMDAIDCLMKHAEEKGLLQRGL